MMNKEVSSYNEWKEILKNSGKLYLLIYKSGSEHSECSLKNLQATQQDNIFYVDVNKVRDIHGQYGITSVPSLLEFDQGEMIKTLKGCEPKDYYESYFNNQLYTAADPKDEPRQKQVIVYTTPTCPHCTSIKKHLDVHGIKYREINVANDQNAAKEMQRKSGQMGVPQADIGGQMVIGFDKVKINKLLQISNN